MNLHFWIPGILIYLFSGLIVYLIVKYQHGPKGERHGEHPSLRHLFFVVVPFINTLAAVVTILSIVTYSIDAGDLSGFFGVKHEEKDSNIEE